MADWELLPKEREARREEPAPASEADRKRRLTLAFVIAALADLLSPGLEFVPPLQWVLDLVTAGLLFLVLGRQWLILPGLIAEAIPGLGLFPFWVLVVGSIAFWGKVTTRRA